MNAPAERKVFRTDDGSTMEERSARYPYPSFAQLSHIPNDGRSGFLSKLRDTRRFLDDTLRLMQEKQERYGNVWLNQNLIGSSVQVAGPHAAEMILMNRDRQFSSELGWTPFLHDLFPRGLMLMDFEEHRGHRRMLQGAFKPSAMQSYLTLMQEGIRRRIAEWPEQLKVYPAMKQLTLDLAASSFLGIPWGAEADRVNRAFVDMMQATISIVRRPLPFTKMRRGVVGRRHMMDFFAREIPRRRGSNAADLFTQIVNLTDEDGNILGDQEIIDHMNFMMVAAHDTLTSSLTSTVYYLGIHENWQDEVRAEADALHGEFGGDIPYDRLGDFRCAEMVFKEAMRLRPPVPLIARRTLEPVTIDKHTIPTGSWISLNVMLTHRMEDVWEAPKRFAPMRFTREEEKRRHKHAFIPFGGGAHTCLGLHFAYMQAKIFLFELTRSRVIDYPDGYEPNWKMVPMPHPRDGLPTFLKRR